MPKFDRVSIVVPVFNNEATLTRLVKDVRAALTGITGQCAFVFVDDASTDGSRDVLRQLAASDTDVCVLENDTNQGQQSSIRTGLAQSDGDVVVVMDSDLQDRPAAIPDLLSALVEGPYDAVFAGRTGSYQSRSRTLSGRVFRALMRCLTSLPKGAGGFVAMRGQVAAHLAAKDHQRFYLVGLLGCSDYRLHAIPVTRDLRVADQSSYSGYTRWKTALSNIAAVLRERVHHAKR